jgi:hypothetical protein
MDQTEIRTGDRYRTLRDFSTHGLIHWAGAPATSGFDCIIPEGTILIVRNDPPPQATAVYELPEDAEEFERANVPAEDRTDPQYGGYSLVMMFKDMGRSFARIDE